MSPARRTQANFFNCRHRNGSPTTSNETRLAGRSRTHDTLRRPNSCKTVSDEPSRISPSGGRFLPCDVKDVESADSMRLKGIHLARTGPQLELIMNHEQGPLGRAHTAPIGELCEEDCKPKSLRSMDPTPTEEPKTTKNWACIYCPNRRIFETEQALWKHTCRVVGGKK